jgi:hypothetical protein
MKKIAKKWYSAQIRIIAGIALVTAAGLFGTYQNFDTIREISSIPDAPTENGAMDIQEEMASDTVTTSENHSILPSVIETVGSVESFKIKTHHVGDLKVLPAIGLRPAEMESIGIISGQKLEAEVNGSSIPVYAYALASNDNAQGINISPAAAKDLGAKVGDKITLRALQESPPKMTEK